mgnify:FL=1
MLLYQIDANNLKPIKKTEFKYERDLQKLTENNMEEVFNLKFVASEFQLDNLRIDTLAFNEETNSFVIIEYKKSKNYSVIDQGYSYLSLLLNNKAEFVLKYNQKFNTNYGKEDIDFTQSKIMFIAPNYTTYQLKSIEFNDLAFELWKVTKYSNNTVLYDKLNISENKASIKEVKTTNKKEDVNKEIIKYTEEMCFNNKPDNIKELYENLKERILNEFEDIEIDATKLYIVFKTSNKIIISIEAFKGQLKGWINLKNTKLIDPFNKTRDVSNIGHHGIGDYEMKIANDEDIDYFISLFKQAYKEKL